MGTNVVLSEGEGRVEEGEQSLNLVPAGPLSPPGCWGCGGMCGGWPSSIFPRAQKEPVEKETGIFSFLDDA